MEKAGAWSARKPIECGFVRHRAAFSPIISSLPEGEAYMFYRLMPKGLNGLPFKA